MPPVILYGIVVRGFGIYYSGEPSVLQISTGGSSWNFVWYSLVFGHFDVWCYESPTTWYCSFIGGLSAYAFFDFYYLLLRSLAGGDLGRLRNGYANSRVTLYVTFEGLLRNLGRTDR